MRLQSCENGLTLLLATMIAISTGCASFDLNKRIPWGAGEDGKPVAPMRLMAVWADTIMTTPGKPAMRGFGGRICFYDQGNEPAKVKGTLIVYAFDENGREQTNVTPDRKYVFLTEDFEKHYSKGRLGHSYSFWLPWDEVGGKQTEISLIVRFQPEKGGEIVGEQTRHLLPGLTVDMAAAKTQFQGLQQQAQAAGAQQPGMPNQLPQQLGAMSPLQPGMNAGGMIDPAISQAAAMLPANGGGATSPMNGAANAGSVKSYTIPLRNSNTLSRPLDALRANPALLEQQGNAAAQQPNMPLMDGAGQFSATALQTQQAMLMQQALAKQQGAAGQGGSGGIAQAAPYQPTNLSSGQTPLSGRSGSNFQPRQIRPTFNPEQTPAGGAMASPAEGALPGSIGGSQPSRHRVLGGTISRLDPAHAR